MNISGKIKTAMKRKNMTQTELAKKISVSNSAVSRWLSSDRSLRAINIKSLCEALDVSADWLLDIKEDKK